MNEPIDWNRLSPVAMFRDWVAKSEAQWSECVSLLLKDEHASGPLNKQIEESRQMQRMFAEMAQVSLAAVNLPSRSDIEALDERLGRLEDGQAAVGIALLRLRAAVANPGALRPTEPADKPKPSRTRRPVEAPVSTPAPARAIKKSAKA
jgi:hypothetical protein